MDKANAGRLTSRDYPDIEDKGSLESGTDSRTPGSDVAADRSDIAPPSDLRRPYHMRIIGELPHVVNGGGLDGVVRNTSQKSWTANHRVGLRNFRSIDGTIIEDFELRADLSLNNLRPGQTASFRFNFANLVLPDDIVACTLDIVEDGVAWLAEEGSVPVELEVAAEGGTNLSDWLLLIDDLSMRVDEADRVKLGLVQKVLVKYDFKQVSNVVQLSKRLLAAAQGLTYAPLQPGSETILKALPGRLADTDRELIFLRHFAALIKEAFDPGRFEKGSRIFARFASEAAEHFRDACIPLPSSLLAWMDERALPHSVASTPASRAMVAVLGARGPLELNPEDGGRDQIWMYATTVMIDRRLPAEAIPSMVLRELVSVDARAGGGLFPLETAFMRRLHRDSEVYHDTYELADEDGRLAFALDLCLLGLENESLRRLLGVKILSWFTAPLAGIEVSALELMLLAICERPVFAPASEAPAEIVRIRQAVDWLVPDHTPPSPPTIRVIGLHTSVSGLGTNMRMSEAALASIGIAPEIVDTERDLVHPPRTSGSIVPSRPIDLFHLNLDEVPALLGRYARRDRPDTYRIGFALWETSVSPEQHRAGIELLDEIWTPTQYVADVYRQAGHPRVHVVGKGIDLPQVRPFDLRDLGIPPGTTVFLVAFDLGSWVDRKNPMAAVEAFRRAFPHEQDVCLLVKSNGLFSHPGDRTRQVARLQAAADDDRRIVLLSEVLDFIDYLGLIQAVNATISPHRAEGFGYLPAYSMLLQTPTIVTDHSGTRDFCTEETSFPVHARLYPLAAGEFVFDAPGAVWAHVDIDHLAARMREVHANPGEAVRRARNGQQLVQELYSIEALAARYLERLSTI